MRKEQRYPAEDRHGARSGKGYTNHVVDPQLALIRPRCPDEPRLHEGYVRDMDKYLREHNRLFSMDHFPPYGPWPTDFAEWIHFVKALYKSSNGTTTTLDVIVGQAAAKGSIVINPSDQWEFRPKVGDRIAISRCHPSMDRVVSGPVTKVDKLSFNIEWKPQWEPFEGFAEKVQPEDNRCPSGHFRVDMEVENISTARVDHALHTLTTVRGMEDHNVSVITPLQAMLAYNDFMAADIKLINDAEADRRRQEDGFTLRWDTSDKRYSNLDASVACGASDANRASDAIGASGAYGAPVASTSSGSKGSRHGDTRSDSPSGSKSRKLTQHDTQEASWSDCWVRPCMYVRPPSDSDFATASRKANLNDGQRHAMTITGKHGLRSVGQRATRYRQDADVICGHRRY